MGVGVSPESLSNSACRVVGSAPRIDLSCGLRRSWRSSCLPTSLGSHQSSVQYSVTAWTHATCTGLVLSWTTPYVCMRIRSLASTSLAVFMHRLWCSWSVKYPSIQMPSQHVTCLLKRMNPSLTIICTGSFGRSCFLWLHLRRKTATSVFVVANCTHRLLAHSILLAAHRSWRHNWHPVRVPKWPGPAWVRSRPSDQPAAKNRRPVAKKRFPRKFSQIHPIWVDPHGRVASHPLTLFRCSSSQNSSFSRIIFGCRERTGWVLMMGSLSSSSRHFTSTDGKVMNLWWMLAEFTLVAFWV